MTGYASFLGKELREIVRTWRVFVVPLVLMFTAVSSPLLAKATPYLVQSVAGLDLSLPEPTYVDAYAQWTKNLGQLALLVVIVSYAGAIASERTSGTAAFVLSKQLTPAAFVTAKMTAAALLVTVATVVSGVVTGLVTWAVFGKAPLGPLVASTAAWLALALLCVTAVILMSALFDATSAAAGLGIAFWIVLAAVSAWGPAARWSPAGLVGAPSTLAAGIDTAWLWPTVTGAVLAVLLVVATVLVVRRREL